MRSFFIVTALLVVALSAHAQSSQRTISIFSEHPLALQTPYIYALQAELKEAGFSVDDSDPQQLALGKVRSAIAQRKTALGLVRLQSHPLKGNVAATLLLTPAAFSSMSEQRVVMQGVIGDSARDEISGNGIFALRLWPYATDTFLSKSLVTKVKDFYKIDTIAHDHSSRAILYALGAAPRTIGAAEVMGAKSTAAAAVLPQGPHSEKLLAGLVGGTVIPEFRTSIGVTLVSSDWWQSLSAREQRQLIKVLEKAEDSAAQAIKKRSAIFWGKASAANLKIGTWQAFSSRDVRKAVSKAIKTVSGKNAKPVLSLLDQVNELLRKQSNPRSNNVPEPDKRGSKEGGARIFFVSNRRHDTDETSLSDQFANSMDQENRFRCGELVPSRAGEFGKVMEQLALTAGSSVLEGDACISLIGSATKDVGGSLLVYVHGYRNSFEKATKTGLAFARDIKSRGAVLIWSWPSAAQYSSYGLDSERILESEPVFRSVVSKLSEEKGVARIDFLAHSMGSRLVADLMRDHWLDRPAAIVMAAADVSRLYLAQAVEAARSASVSLLSTEADLALMAAQLIYTEPRAGRAKPIFLLEGMDTINLTAFDSLWSVNHGHMFFQPEVVKDLMRLFKGKWSAAERGLTARRFTGSEINYFVILPGDS